MADASTSTTAGAFWPLKTASSERIRSSLGAEGSTRPRPGTDLSFTLTRAGTGPAGRAPPGGSSGPTQRIGRPSGRDSGYQGTRTKEGLRYDGRPGTAAIERYRALYGPPLSLQALSLHGGR